MKSIIYLLCACLVTCLFSSGCKHTIDYEKSSSVQLTTLLQDSLIRYNPQEVEMLLEKAKRQAQDSTEYYYAEAVHSSLLMTRQQEDSAFYYINRCEKFSRIIANSLPHAWNSRKQQSLFAGKRQPPFISQNSLWEIYSILPKRKYAQKTSQCL